MAQPVEPEWLGQAIDELSADRVQARIEYQVDKYKFNYIYGCRKYVS